MAASVLGYNSSYLRTQELPELAAIFTNLPDCSKIALTPTRNIGDSNTPF
jgi:hypothetical protein